MIFKAGNRFDKDNYFLTEIDTSVPTCEVSGELNGVPVSFFGDVEEGLIIGGAVEWNQLTANDRNSITIGGVDFTNGGEGKITANGTATANSAFFSDANPSVNMIPDHVYYFCGCPSGGSGTTYRLGLTQGGSSIASDYGVGAMIKARTNETGLLSTVVFVSNGTTVNNLEFTPQVFDITQMFGSTIADYIYSLEHGTTGAGIAIFKALFPDAYYEYNVGAEKTITLR